MQTDRTRLQFQALVAIYSFMLALGYLMLSRLTKGTDHACWLVVSGSLAAYVLLSVKRNLHLNVSVSDGTPFCDLGLANAVTLVRGMLIAMAAGFLCLENITVAILWAPAILYSVAAAMDGLDGKIARASGRVSQLGQWLDMHLDAIGVLVASALAVRYGRLPWWYLTVGLARYLFLIGLWVARRLGKTPGPMPPSRARRWLAGAMMTFLAASLYPIWPKRPLLVVGAILFVPFIGGFIQDFVIMLRISIRLPSPQKLGSVLILGTLLWFARKVPWQETWRALQAFSPVILIALLLLNVLILWLFALRWWWLLRVAGHPVPWRRLTSYRVAAFSVSYFTPGSQFGGEPLQVLLLHRREDVPLPQAIATVGLDKLFELVGNFGFLLLGAWALAESGLTNPSARWGLLAGASALALAAAGYIVMVCRGANPLRWMTERLKGRLASLLHHGAQAESAAATLCRARPGVGAQSILLALPTWLALVGEYALMTRGLGMHLTLVQILVVMTAARLAFLLPMLPGGLGALEGGLMFAAQALGYDPALGLALALVIRLRDLAVGAWGFSIFKPFPRLSWLRKPGRS